MGDYLYIYDSSLINLMNVYDRSFSIWFKAANISSSAQVIFEEGGTSNGISFYLYGEELYYGFWGTTITNTFLSTPFTDINSWHHMGFTFDSVNGIQKAFLDGVEVGSSDRIGYIPAHSGDIAIGADKDGLIYHYGTDSGGPQNYFNGTIDEVKIWNRALSPEEIQFLYDYYQ
jgi:hypothetical protein